MDIQTYLERTETRQHQFARQFQVSQALVSQWIHGSVPPIKAVEIERALGGQVTRPEMRREDWWLIWPELAPLYPHLLPPDHPDFKQAA
ncbi:transcriptional regulator [Chitinimonas koreensis]|uniref:transcriptional regulator n=1 Tax=Chitinimonas koreensis TaxID=356302 RepID=UPI000683DA09|nr:helix-turn-helix domain-containing protein [Chitinimonas koreensis]